VRGGTLPSTRLPSLCRSPLRGTDIGSPFSRHARGRVRQGKLAFFNREQRDLLLREPLLDEASPREGIPSGLKTLGTHHADGGPGPLRGKGLYRFYMMAACENPFLPLSASFYACPRDAPFLPTAEIHKPLSASSYKNQAVIRAWVPSGEIPTLHRSAAGPGDSGRISRVSRGGSSVPRRTRLPRLLHDCFPLSPELRPARKPSSLGTPNC